MDSFKNFKQIELFFNHSCNLALLIGKSVKHKPIYAYHFGNFGKFQILITASTHAREYVTTKIAYLLASNHTYENMGAWVIPCVNPDGVEIVMQGNPNFKANSNLVDINVNFDANWGQGKSNITYPHYENYVGPYPCSEIETKTLVNFVHKLTPCYVLNLHTKGEVIYYGNFLTKEQRGKDKFLANQLCKSSNFECLQTKDSFGGFSDYCEMKLNIPSLTIEYGNDNLSHPIPLQLAEKVFYPTRNYLKIIENLH